MDKGRGANADRGSGEAKTRRAKSLAERAKDYRNASPSMEEKISLQVSAERLARRIATILGRGGFMWFGWNYGLAELVRLDQISYTQAVALVCFVGVLRR